MATAQPIIVGLGEILWDMLPGGKQLGGAPANFAYHAHALGAKGSIVSAVGADEQGQEIILRLQKLHESINVDEIICARAQGENIKKYVISEWKRVSPKI